MISSAYYEVRVKIIITNVHAVCLSLSRENIILFGKTKKSIKLKCDHSKLYKLKRFGKREILLFSL